jgi:hypothetical protein
MRSFQHVLSLCEIERACQLDSMLVFPSAVLHLQASTPERAA